MKAFKCHYIYHDNMSKYITWKTYENIQHHIYESIERLPFKEDILQAVNTHIIEEETGLSHEESYELASMLGKKLAEKSRILLELELEEYIGNTDLMELFVREWHKVLSRDIYKIISEKCRIEYVS
jgi:uncharacterized membrane protein YcjF (UPF0283 family)